MNRQLLINLQKILAELYEDERSIRRIISDAGITSSTMSIDAHALNSWHSVLTEAEKHHQVEPLLQVIESEFGDNRAFRSACYAYRRSAVHTGNTILARLFPIFLIGLLLSGIAAGSWYWGVFGLLGWGGIIPATNPIVPSLEPTKQVDTVTATLTQTLVLSVTSTSTLSNNTPTPPLTLQPTATVVLILTFIPSYPCEAEVISQTGAQRVYTLRAKPSLTSSVSESVAVGSKVLIIQKAEDTFIWYRVTHPDGIKLGWIPAENLNLSFSCPK